MKKVIGVGAGGHARVVLDALQCRGDVEVVGFVDTDPRLHGTTVMGVPILGGDEQLPLLLNQGVDRAFLGASGVRDNSVRRRVAEELIALGFELHSSIHPSAVVSSKAIVGQGTVVLAGAVVNAGAVLGCAVVVNTGAIVEHDCTVGDYAHVAPGAVLGGGAQLGVEAFAGAGAVVGPWVKVGFKGVIGAGAVALKDVAAETTVVGVPATILRSNRGPA